MSERARETEREEGWERMRREASPKFTHIRDISTRTFPSTSAKGFGREESRHLLNWPRASRSRSSAAEYERALSEAGRKKG